MGAGLVLITGGARSGKSALAEQLAGRQGGRVLFVATGEPGDEEMAARIARHRLNRPGGWVTLEVPLDVGRRIEECGIAADTLILDCITLLASNAILACADREGFEQAGTALTREIDNLLEVYARSLSRWIIVTNEVGQGLVPPTALGRFYRDELGRANQRLAQAADEVYWMVSGLPLRIKTGTPGALYA